MKVKVLARYTKHSDGYIRVRLSDGRILGEHRYIMEKHLGRKLKPSEIVHHKDENKKHNVLSNFEVHTVASHSALHAFRGGETMIPLTCADCGRDFLRPKRNVTWHKTLGQKRFFCNRTCMGRRLMQELSENRKLVARHGTRHMYNYHGCRCQPCVEAQRTYMREYMRYRGLV